MNFHAGAIVAEYRDPPARVTLVEIQGFDSDMKRRLRAPAVQRTDDPSAARNAGS
jgi:hypothetical protein